MEKPKDADPAATDQASDAGQDIEEAQEAIDVTESADAGEELPVEPRLPWATPADETGVQAYDAAEAKSKLLGFHVYGRRESDESPQQGEELPMPASLYPYRDLSLHRYDYPVCISDADPGNPVRSLSEIIDGLLEDVAEEGDEGKRLKRHVYRLESVIKANAEKAPGIRLSEVWEQSAEDLLSSSQLSSEKKDILRDNLSAARKALDWEGEVFPCSAEIPEQLFTAAMVAHWRQRCSGFREELDAVIQQLQDILVVDFEHSPDAKRPDHLREMVAPRTGEEIDSSVLSDILNQSQLGAPLTQERGDRVRNTLSSLLDIKPLFDVDGGSGAPPFRIDLIEVDCASAVTKCETRMRVMVEFFRAVRVARLEIANGYREAVHDAYFASFDRSYLTDEEIALCPPVLLKLETESLADAEPAALLRLLSGNVPVKVLLRIDDIYATPGADDQLPVTVGWPSRLASMAMALNHAFILQTPMSRPHLTYSSFLKGIGYQGPALFAVYTGTEDRAELSAYLETAAAAESRCYPVLVFDPSGGDTLATRIQVGDNPQSDADWPTEPFTYRTADDEEVTVALAFTAADFLFRDQRLADHFWRVPPEQWHENMVTLEEYMTLDETGVGTKVPYITTIDDKGRLGRAVMTRTIIDVVGRCRSSWRQLQEVGGINNSFALDLVAGEKERLADEKQRQVEEIEKDYVAQIDQDIGELTREIIQRIANRLIAEGGNGSGSSLGAVDMPAPPRADSGAVAAPVVVETEEAPAAQKEQDDDEDIAVLDDAYIDTPLCTSCNECTKLNSQIFAYNANKQAYIEDAAAGPFKDLVRAAELCPVRIIHPGKPMKLDEPDIDQWIERAARFA
jgi:ferredoxin